MKLMRHLWADFPVKSHISPTQTHPAYHPLAVVCAPPKVATSLEFNYTVKSCDTWKSAAHRELLKAELLAHVCHGQPEVVWWIACQNHPHFMDSQMVHQSFSLNDDAVILVSRHKGSGMRLIPFLMCSAVWSKLCLLFIFIHIRLESNHI